jgi:rubrerythrin
VSTRRAFVAGAAVVLAAPRVAWAKEGGEVAALTDAIKLEQVAAYVYDAGVKSGLLDAEQAALAGRLRDHEQQHADALAVLLEALGGHPPGAPDTPESADAALTALGVETGLRELRDANAFLALSLELEQRQAAHYTASVAKIGDIRLIQTLASILAAEGQHLVVIRRALERAPIPTPLESGRP